MQSDEFLEFWDQRVRSCQEFMRDEVIDRHQVFRNRRVKRARKFDVREFHLSRAWFSREVECIRGLFH